MTKIRRNELRQARMARGWTALDIAESLEITENRVFAVERGRARPKHDEAARWASIFDLPVESLFPDLGAPRPPKPREARR